jgi:hypothetical protein
MASIIAPLDRERLKRLEISRSHLNRILHRKRSEVPSNTTQVSSKVANYFKNRLEEIINFVATEAMKDNQYVRLDIVDIERGFQKWHESKITGKLKIAVEGGG